MNRRGLLRSIGTGAAAVAAAAVLPSPAPDIEKAVAKSVRPKVTAFCMTGVVDFGTLHFLTYDESERR